MNKKKTATEYYKEKLEERRRILFPLTVLKSEKLNKLDEFLDKRNELGLKSFWSDLENIEGMDYLRVLSEELKEKRNVSQDDMELIKSITEDYKTYKPSFDISGSVGVFLQIERCSEEISKKNLPNSLRIPLLFWLYLTFIESAVNDLSEIFLEIANKRKDIKFAREFEKNLNRGEHFLFSQLRRYAISWGYTEEKKKTFLHKSNLRNEIAHANIWYDESRNKILLRGRMELSTEEFIKEFLRVYDFFKELIFHLNNCQSDLTEEIRELTKKVSREFLKISRSGPKKQIWKNEIKFDWEKEESETKES
jgi:hypothetical protein